MSLAKLQKISEHLDIDYLESVTLGARGQVVIPARIRRKLKLKAGQRLICVLRSGRFIGMVKMSDISPITKMLSKMIAGNKVIK
ncbi:MAG: AbrB/MazE/SpoVT family DNA-binding domain-containing protein [Patescibacteria group bacterium]